jgi:biotin synthase
MCRITWPAFPEEQVWDALERESSTFERICIQVVNGPGSFDRAKEWVQEVKDRCDTPISVETRVNGKDDVANLLHAGADCVGLPLDVASERLHPELRGGRVDDALELILSSADRFPGRISSHVIVGLGETDRDIVNFSRQILERSMPLGLFAFTPCKGTKMEKKDPPSIARFRRIQLATHLIAGDASRTLGFDSDGRVILPSFEDDNLDRIVEEALTTRGCDGCNRPAYNERPGCTPYNYPEKLTDLQIEEELRVMPK